MDFLNKLSSRALLYIYIGVAALVSLVWLVFPEYTFTFWGSANLYNGYAIIALLSRLNYGFLAFLTLGNFILPGVALVVTLVKRQVNWIWVAVTLGYYFTTGILMVCVSGFGISYLWYLMFFVIALWAVVAFMTRDRAVWFTRE